MKFQEGKTYATNFGSEYVCVKVTDKTASFEKRGEVKRYKLREFHTGEQFVMLGNYSMAPALNAGREASEQTRRELHHNLMTH